MVILPIWPPNWLTWQSIVRDRSSKISLIISNHISTIFENLVKIDLVHSEVIVLQQDCTLLKFNSM